VIVAHLSDLHLGFRAYGRVERGGDVRERDIAVAFDRCIQELVRLRPDVVVVAGDVFDRPDPPAGALVALTRGLEVLRASVPATPVLMVAGPRDTPRRPGDPGALAVLDTFPNVEAATGLTRSILVEELDLHACLLPHRAAVRTPPAVPEPHPKARWNILVVHARVAPASGLPSVDIDGRDWDYVALGGLHRHTRIGEGVHYSGAIERVALDPWDEGADEKGFLVVDLKKGTTSFRAIPGRAVAALAPIKAKPGDPDHLRRRVREVTGEVPGGIDGKIVRLRLEGVGPRDLLALQGEDLHALRQRALHLMVEAGTPLRTPAEAWLTSGTPELLEPLVREELERDGVWGEDVAEVLRGALADEADGAGAAPLGAVDRGGFAELLQPGLTAVIGGGGRIRRALTAHLTAHDGSDGESSLRALWAGVDTLTLEAAVRRATEAVAEARGVGVLDRAIERLAGLDSAIVDMMSAEAVEDRPVRPGSEARARELVAALERAEDDLRSLRGDVAEVDGEVEVATMGWLRERQDAETTLHAFRDRARELRARLRAMEAAGRSAACPTCGRVLESHYEEVLAELKDEWESVVQDGSWWRNRREQLELKPAALQELEGRSLRHHAALEASSERVELLKARVREETGGALTGPRAGAVGEPGSDAGPRVLVARVLLRMAGARRARARDILLDRASRFVARMSGGRMLAVTSSGSGAELQGDAGPLSPLSEEDLAVGRLALRLAGASLVAGRGRVMASLTVEEPFDRMDEEARLRALDLMQELRDEIPSLFLLTRGDSVDARPEVFDAIFELREDAEGLPTLTRAAAGWGAVTFREHVPVRRARAAGKKR